MMDALEYESRTDRLIDILTNDGRLEDGVAGVDGMGNPLSMVVTVHKGLPRLGPGSGCHVWVHWDRTNSVEHQVLSGNTVSGILRGGGRQVHDGIWRIWMTTPQPEVEEVEARIERLVANVVRILADHVEDPIWNYAVLTDASSTALGTEQWGFFRIAYWDLLIRFRLCRDPS